MILQSLYKYAQAHNLLDLNQRAFKPRSVHWLIDLDDQGRVIGAIDTQIKDSQSGSFSCPHSIQDKSRGGIADFLVDGSVAIFGIDMEHKQLSEKQQLKRNENNRKKFDDFWKQIQTAHEITQSPLLASLLRFRPQYGQPPEFMRWGIKATDQENNQNTKNEKLSWWIQINQSGAEKKLKGTENYGFSIHQKVITDDPSVRAYWLREFTTEVEEELAQAPRGLCSITGQQDQPLAKSHTPKIKGVPNTQSFGANIVSFNEDAFESYEFEQSLGAAASVESSSGYCRALNQMLNKSSAHSIALGSAVCCFWTKKPNDDFAVSLSNLFEQAHPDDVSSFLQSAHKGKTSSISHDRFYSLILSGNAGRIMIRHWIDIPLENAEKNFRSWFQDLAMIKIYSYNTKVNSKKNMSSSLSLYRLACTTVREAKDLRTEVTNQLFKAAFNGQAPSLTLLQSIIGRLRIDIAKDGEKALYNHSAFALMRLLLNRNQRIHKENNMEITPELNQNSTDPGYLCGRLLAVLSRAQQKAHNYSLSTGVSERYFGTAMASPQSVFPILLKLNRHHLNKIDKSDPRGLADDFIERDIQDIVKHLQDFPRSLDIRGQGRFALGYYQEQASERQKIREYKTKKASSDIE